MHPLLELEMMSNNEDYYQILGVVRVASAKQIKDAYLYKVHILHPDRMSMMPERVRMQAEEDLKKGNKAYEILSDIRKRAQYDLDTLKTVEPRASSHQKKESSETEEPIVSSYPKKEVKGKPKLEIYPKTIFFDKVTPYQKQKGTFWIRNLGGSYSKIMISDPPKWIIIKQTKALYPTSKLPMQVDIEAVGIYWGKTLSSRIKVKLDETEKSVEIKLRTKKK
ncbi:J domain-containing protein [Chloroflexota bacterium]